jgi:hypothetical protein
MSVEICEPRRELCPCGCGEEVLFYCVQQARQRDPGEPKQATFLCWECLRGFGVSRTSIPTRNVRPSGPGAA